MYTIREQPESRNTEMPVGSSVAKGGAVNGGNEVGGHGSYSPVNEARLANLTEGRSSHGGALVSRNFASSNASDLKALQWC
jgi:hypothetical protein